MSRLSRIHDLEAELGRARSTIAGQRRSLDAYIARCCQCPLAARVRASHDLHVTAVADDLVAADGDVEMYPRAVAP